jgi:phosphoinositide-3-kinase regulatory subunit 4
VQIPDIGIRKMIQHMIQLEPESRFSAEIYLKEFAGVVFPTYFSPFLHDFYRCWTPLHSDMRVYGLTEIFFLSIDYLIFSYNLLKFL